MSEWHKTTERRLAHENWYGLVIFIKRGFRLCRHPAEKLQLLEVYRDTQLQGPYYVGNRCLGIGIMYEKSMPLAQHTR